MKKLFILALVLMLALSASAMAETKLEKILATGKITMATSPDFAPSEFIDPNKSGQDMYAGADIELAKYIAEKLGVELVIEAMEFSAVQAAISQGNVDMAISGFAYTEERAENMGLSIFFNTEPAEGDGQSLLVRKDELDQYQKAEDFAGKVVAVQNASLQYNLLTSQIPDAIPEIITNLNDAIMMLITKKVDAVGVDAENGNLYAANYDDIILSTFFYEYESDGNVLAVTKGEDDLLAAINEILLEVNEQGLYQQWRKEATELAKSLGIEVND